MRVLDQDRMEARAVAVVTADRRLADTRRAFDAVAETYDGSNRRNRILAAMRSRVIAAVRSAIPRGSRVLDLGCGPGTDDVELARIGYQVTAIDWSPAMIGAARRAVRDAGVDRQVNLLDLGIHQLDRLTSPPFDGALSNFGALNCVPDLAAAATLIAQYVRPGGTFVASAIGRVCPWEIALYVARGDVKRAAIRWSREAVPVPLDGRTIWTRYYSPREFCRTFAAAGFSLVSLRTLGLVAPPPYLEAFADRHRNLIERLQRMDDWIGALPVARSLGDHFLVVLRRM
jgi:ubiquinone/menaquinone biosynthesis C-methylase UbiE